jgi:hypothetical protein
MRLLRQTKDRFVYHLGKRERDLLLVVLRLYPRLPPAHQQLSKSGTVPDYEENQHLLDEALAEHRRENRERLEEMLSAPNRFKEASSGCQLTLSPSEREWLLQVLNDIRVGSWVRLGSPENGPKEVTKENAPDLWTMEAAGAFQMGFLQCQTAE